MQLTISQIELPDYVREGAIELLVLVVGGLLVGWITHTYFARKAAIVEVEGEVMKRRLSIYEELYRRLNMLLSQEVLPHERINAAVRLIQQSGMEAHSQPNASTLTVMNQAKHFTDVYMDLDTYITQHRLYFETQVDRALLYFSNYFAIFRRLQVMFEEQIIDMNLSLDDASIAKAEDLLMTQISLLYQDELDAEITKVLTSLKAALNTPIRHKRKARDHSLATFGAQGEILKNLQNLEIFKQREQIQRLIASNVALAMASHNMGKS